MNYLIFISIKESVELLIKKRESQNVYDNIYGYEIQRFLKK